MGSLQPKLLQLVPSRHRLPKNIVTTSTLSHRNRNLSRFLEGAQTAPTFSVSVRARPHELSNNMRSTAAGRRRYDATKAAAAVRIGASSSRLLTTANSPSKLSRSAKPKLPVGMLSSSLTSSKDCPTDAARRSFSRLSSRSSTTCRAYSSTTSDLMQRYPPSNTLPAIQSTSLSHYYTTSSSSRTRQWWDALVAGIVAIASASWLVSSPTRSSRAACESSDSNATASAKGPAAASVLLASSATPAESGGEAAAVVAPHATANVVSFRPRWFDTILTSVSGGSSSRGGSDDDSSSSLGNQDSRGVLLQSTGKPYDVRFLID
jgi:hypothetical protein